MQRKVQEDNELRKTSKSTDANHTPSSSCDGKHHGADDLALTTASNGADSELEDSTELSQHDPCSDIDAEEIDVVDSDTERFRRPIINS